MALGWLRVCVRFIELMTLELVLFFNSLIYSFLKNAYFIYRFTFFLFLFFFAERSSGTETRRREQCSII